MELKIHEEKIPIALVMGTSTGWLVARFTIGCCTRGKACGGARRAPPESRGMKLATEGISPFFLLSLFHFFFFFLSFFFLNTYTPLGAREFLSPILL